MSGAGKILGVLGSPGTGKATITGNLVYISSIRYGVYVPEDILTACVDLVRRYRYANSRETREGKRRVRESLQRDHSEQRNALLLYT